MDPQDKDQVEAAEATKAEETKKNPLDEAFERLRRNMFEKFKARINTRDEDHNIQALILGERIIETFELFNAGGKSLSITFRSTNEEEEDFALSISYLNRQQVAMNPGTVQPLYDENRRYEYLMAMAILAINDTQYPTLDVEDARLRMREERGKKQEEGYVPVAITFIDSIDDRIKEIKRRLPRGGMHVAVKAFQVWLKYQASLLTGEKLENF